MAYGGVLQTIWSDVGVGALVLLVSVLALAWRGAEGLWWRPRRLERALRAQGLRGTPYRFLYGDLKENTRLNSEARSNPIPLSHDIIPRVAPLFNRAISQHGKFSFTWSGPTPAVMIMNPDLVREVLSDKFGYYGKPKLSPLGKLTNGIANQEGEKWATNRRIMHPAFHLEKLKRMLPAFSTCCSELISRWDNLVGSEGSSEVNVWPELQNFTRDVISRAGFGSSYEEGSRVFQLQEEQVEHIIQAAQAPYIPGYRFLPTPKNMRWKEIAKEVEALLRGIIEKKEKAVKMGGAKNNDLLGLLMESNSKEFEGHGKSTGMTTEELIEECKLLYFAGQETTSSLLTWTMIVLSMHPSWQVRAREEVLQVFGRNKPDFDGLNRLKIVTMILYEVLRLYPPAIILGRRTCKKVELGGITLPPEVYISLPIIFIHHNEEIWGEDAKEFHPLRFAEGISKASNNQVAFFPFSWGPRVCIGQSFAMMEAKMALSVILQHFSFELSPSYTHAPHSVITLQPQHGAHIMLTRL